MKKFSKLSKVRPAAAADIINKRLPPLRLAMTKGVTIMAYTLPPLAYPYNALEPHIDARTMEIHHTKHHQAYINNVNNAIKGKADLESKSVEQLIANINCDTGRYPQCRAQ